MHASHNALLGATPRERLLFCSWALVVAVLSVFLVSQATGDTYPTATAHRERQARPISLGTSGDSFRTCGAVGTLGSLVEGKLTPIPTPSLTSWGLMLMAAALVVSGLFFSRRRHLRPTGLSLSVLLALSSLLYAQNLQAAGEKQFILSNAHVLAASPAKKVGDRITQPGGETALGAAGNCGGPPDCTCAAADQVAKLSAWVPRLKLGANTVDAAIAEIVTGKVLASGSILDIGPPGTTPVAASTDLKVAKSGRTSGLTVGMVTMTGVTITVDGRKFVNQIRIEPIGASTAPFCLPGDSGSLVVAGTGACPGPVGLFFAGGGTPIGTECFANPIQTVLKGNGKWDVAMVGCTAEGFSGGAPTAGLPATATPVAGGDAVREAREALARWETRLLEMPGVVGVGVGRSESRPGEPAIRVLCSEDSPELRAALPTEIEGFAVEVEVTGPIELF